MIDYDAIATDLMQSFNRENVVLFIGTNGRKELGKEIYELPWSCIITTIADEGFGNEFSLEERRAQRITEIDNLPTKIFNRRRVPIIQVFSESSSGNKSDDILANLANKRRMKQAETMLSAVFKRIDIRSSLVVLGYSPDEEDEFPAEDFVLLLDSIPGGRVTFFNTESEANEGFALVKRYSQQAGFEWHDVSLTTILETQRDKDSIENWDLTGNKCVFYKAQKPVTIDKSILLRNQNFAQLLNEDVINEINPQGKIALSKWFYNFLNNSSEEPQWYGYRAQSEYYVKRSFEDALVALVRNILFGRSMAVKDSNTPIILCGAPGSSKSIELGATAYRIYNEKIYPVIYIKNDNLSFYSQSPELKQLDELMMEIENAGDIETKILLIWDSASYRNVSQIAKTLVHELSNRGRRFVLLCTAYGNPATQLEENDKDVSAYDFFEGQGFKPSADPNATIIYDKRNYYVTASRKMSEEEIVKLKRKAIQYANVEPPQLDSIWIQLNGTNDIFNYFYRLIAIIRPKLEYGLTREQRRVNEYVERQLRIIGGEEVEDKPKSDFALALEAAGIVLDGSFAEEDEQVPQDEFNLQRFNLCIAMFSRFKLDTPYRLAFYILRKNSETETNMYSEKNRKLFDLLTKSITYIWYGENEQEDFVFRFRNSLEAELFIEKNEVSVSDQLSLVQDILEYYAKDFRSNGSVEEEIKYSIQKLLRMLGPNTDYTPFQKDGIYETEHKKILESLNVLTTSLKTLREDYEIPDDDASFANIEITFLREFYGGHWDYIHNFNKAYSNGYEPWDCMRDVYNNETYEERIVNLNAASDLALESIQKIDTKMKDVEFYLRRNFNEQINSLTVELSICNRELEKLLEEYSRYCVENKIALSNKIRNIKPLPYELQYQRLLKAISAAPLNGYAYNALFALFEREYERSDQESRLQKLSEIRMIADDASMLDITDRGMNDVDELGRHLSRIASFSSEYHVSIEDIESKSTGEAFTRLFDDMLLKNNSSAICFVCQQELDKTALDGKSLNKALHETEGEFILSEEQVNTCERIIDFMQKTEYAACVNGNQYAIYLLLRVAWMYYNERPLTESMERQKTYLTLENWESIKNICEAYLSCKGDNKRPIVKLLYALSIIEITSNYEYANDIIRELNETDFYSTPRMRVPFLICEPDGTGTPKLYSGKALRPNPKRHYEGRILVDGMPKRIGGHEGVFFTMNNINLKAMPQENDIIRNLELGIGYRGYSLYKERGEESGQ